MRRLPSFILALVPALMLFASCMHTRPEGARLSSSEAVRLAKEAAKRDGISLSGYKRSATRYRDDRTWFVFFESRGVFKPVGASFAASVDDRTGATRISYGE